MEERLVRLEIEVKMLTDQQQEAKIDHRHEMKEIRSAVNTLSKEFAQIITLVKSIKWWLIGAVSVMLMSEAGFAKVVLKLITGGLY